MTRDEAVINAALRQERAAIARMLRAEADECEQAAADLRADYDRAEIEDEAWDYESDARLINRLADLILARAPVVAEPEAPELVF